ncbi:C-type lectin domain family 10 member A-like [Seriola aureovittata]|uniref:C-type lectin domain family 10 member A-like n=1 Tax=Seriola aureovittata TaxID=2871759 RepID=UPI0024BEA704|nr:C-type lectin domain family 10 member A-like [Seriola aureovittata]
MKKKSKELTENHNPAVSVSAEELEDEEADYVNSATCTVNGVPAPPASDKKSLSFAKSWSPVAVCWGILLVIMALRIHFTSVISTKLSNETEQKDLEVQINELRQASRVLEDNITNLMSENQWLREENHRLREENRITTTPVPQHSITPRTTGWNSQPYTLSSPWWRYDNRKKRQSDPCQTGWIHFLSSCYAIDHRDPPDLKTWEEARDDCRGRNADLFVIDSPEEKEFIYNSTLASHGSNGFWIGLRVEDGSWKWINGHEETEDSWILPPGGSRHCAMSVTETKGWRAESCDVKHAWICEENAPPL